jgi:hypothetical protein
MGGWPGLSQSSEIRRVARPSSAWAGTLLLIHHKRPAITITDIQPPVGDNGADLLCKGRGVSVKKDSLREEKSSPGSLITDHGAFVTAY